MDSSNILVSSSWDTIKLVGKGGSSLVYKARFTDSGRIVAVKQIDTDGLSKDQISSIKGEIETIRGLHDPNIISYYGTQQTLNKINIFLEYADRGSLRQFYRKKGPMNENQVINCTRQMLSGLKYLHEKGIAHRDIKCANCLLTQKGIVKLADFGASKRFESESLVSGLKGTPNWMAPEVIKGVQMTSGWLKADVWSLGCTIVEMLTAKMPFADEYDNPMTAMYHIANGLPPSVQNINCSDDLKTFIKLCCSADPVKRPTIKDLLLNPLICKKENGQSKVQNEHNDAPNATLPPIVSPKRVSVETKQEEEEEIVEEIENENDYSNEMFDEEESVEDETESHNSYGGTMPYHEEESMLSECNVSILSEAGSSLTQKLGEFTSSGYTTSSTTIRGVPPTGRSSRSDELLRSPVLTTSPNLKPIFSSSPTRISQHSTSAPTSRVTTASASIDLSPRAMRRRELSEMQSSTASIGMLRLSEELKAIEKSQEFRFNDDRPTAPLSGEIHRIQNKMKDSVILNSDSLSRVASGRQLGLPRSIPKDLSNRTLQTLSQSSSASSIKSSSSRNSNGISSLEQTKTNKPRRRVASMAISERSRSAGVEHDLTLSTGRASLPPVSSDSSNLSPGQFDRQIQSAPPVIRPPVVLPPISPGHDTGSKASTPNKSSGLRSIIAG